MDSKSGSCIDNLKFKFKLCDTVIILPLCTSAARDINHSIVVAAFHPKELSFMPAFYIVIQP